MKKTTIYADLSQSEFRDWATINAKAKWIFFPQSKGLMLIDVCPNKSTRFRYHCLTEDGKYIYSGTYPIDRVMHLLSPGWQMFPCDMVFFEETEQSLLKECMGNDLHVKWLIYQLNPISWWWQ